MAEQVVELKQFLQGYFLEWIVTSQYKKEVIVTLKEGEKEYFSSTKVAGDAKYLLLTKGNETVSSEEPLKLSISVDDGPDVTVLRYDEHFEPIISNSGLIIGGVYNCCADDMSILDSEGVYIHITGWANR